MASGAAAASPLVPDGRFARPAGEDALRRAAALTAKGFTVEILDDARGARARVRDLLPIPAVLLDRPIRPRAASAFRQEEARQARTQMGIRP